MLLFIVRHGDPIYSPDSLTELGILQAKAVAKRFAVNGLDEVYTSPLNRAKMTAQPTCDMLKMEYKIEDWMSESLAHKDLSYINEQGVRRWVFHRQLTELKNNKTVRLNEKWYEADCFKDNKEQYKKGYERICNESDIFLEKLGYKRSGAVYEILQPNEKRIAVFCHQGFGVSWISHLLNIPPHIFWSSFDITHTGVTVINFKNYNNGITNPICLQLSDTSHIFNEGLPLKYNNNINL